MYSCVLFDLDQTLLLRTPTIPQKLYEMISELGSPCAMDEVNKAFADCEYWIGEQTTIENQTGIRMSDEEFLEKMTAFYQAALNIPQKGIADLQTVICRQYTRTYSLMPDAVGLLSALKEKGVKLGIVSNNYASIRQAISDVGLTAYFDDILYSSDYGIKKPAGEFYDALFQKHGLKKEDSVMIGNDRFADAGGAEDYGIASIYLHTEQSTPFEGELPKHCRQVKDLREIIKEINV